MFTPSFQPMNYQHSCQLFNKIRAYFLCAEKLCKSLTMLLVFPVTNLHLSSKIFWALCCNFGCNFGRLPGLQQLSRQPRNSRQLEKFSASHWAHTLASDNYTNVNTIATFSSLLLKCISISILFVRHWLLCNVSHCTVRVNNREIHFKTALLT